ncbi:pentatricopeptide repeat-containing protein At4g18520, chloroplastic-like isoform X2 [Vigna unguiculata]|uniref:Cell division protease FtsH n=1 Tax=Vigna unguiculata TaxID=3917 RepID=A0A4D6L2X4_VIGUN|nr:pentatricopeptide repeat-containing protein At4g18520, chloroplastic-like isoform X2 [Vigna unguiculata]QCD82828.1 cell division protease FtsH [Vigna unguiculata]
MELPLRTAILHSSSSLQQRFHTHKPTPELPSPFSLFLANPLRLPSSTFASKDQQHYFPAKATGTRAVLNPISKGLSCTGAFCGDSSCDDDDDDGKGFLDNYEMIFRDCDKLIESFMLHETDWRKFLILNKKWSNIRPHFFRHCQDKADAIDNPVLKNKLLWLRKKLKEIDEELQRHNELILMIKENPSEISEIVSRSRRDFTREFFTHLHTIAESSVNNLETQNDFAKLRNMCLAAVKDYDSAMESIEALNAAELNFQDVIKSPSDTSCWKIDNLGEKNQCFNPELVAHWLQLCYNVEEVRRVHAIVLKCFRHSNTYIDNNLICSYLRLVELDRARCVFDGMPRKNTVTWTAIIDGYLKCNLDDEAFKLFQDSVKHGVPANSKMFVCIMNLSGKRVDLKLGKQIHARILKSRWRNIIVDNAVVHFYAKCGDISSAFRAFDCMTERDVICWTTMITACSQQGFGYEAMLMLSQMLGEGFFPNEYTICSALKACGENKALKFGTQLHGAIIKNICKSDVFIGTSLVDMYAKCGLMVDSKGVFDRMKIRNTATWTSIISGYARNGFGEEAINLFRLMESKRIHVNKLTVLSVLMACGTTKALLIGREVHAQIIKRIFHTNMYIGSTLVWFYCKCKEYSYAFKVLQHMPLRDVVSWTAIISGCARLGLELEALEFLQEMMEEGVLPNSYTYSSALKACAELEAPMLGKLIHSYASKSPASSNVFVNSALIYMYSKCGYVADAFQVFDNMPEKNLVSWESMILAYAWNGHAREALKLVHRMQAEGFVVDDYIHTTVVSACGGVEHVDIHQNSESSSYYLHS